MKDEGAFHSAMLADPADVLLRLAFADWLEEQGDPRAELVRLTHTLTQSVDVPGRPELEARLRDLLSSGVRPAAHSGRWRSYPCTSPGAGLPSPRQARRAGIRGLHWPT